MRALVIKANNQNQKILKKLAEHLGAEVTLIKEEQYEDFLFGKIMHLEKTGKMVSRKKIIKKLYSK